MINIQFAIFKLLEIGIYLRFGTCYLIFQLMSQTFLIKIDSPFTSNY